MYAANALQLADGADRGKVNITATYLEILGFGYNSVSLTADLAVAGANGLDTGTEAANTWYAVHVMNSSSGGPIASLLSTSATAPTLPAGYGNSRRVGWVRNNGTSDLYRIINAPGDDWFYYNENTTTGDFVILNVTTSATTWTDVVAFAPNTSRAIKTGVYASDVAGTALYVFCKDKLMTNSAAASGTIPVRAALSTAELTVVHGWVEVGVNTSQTFQYVSNATTVDVIMQQFAYKDIR